MKIKPFYFFLILLWSAEAFLGLAVIKFLHYTNSSASYRGENPPALNLLEIFVGVSLFALGNLFFSVARARRHNYLTKQQGKLNAVLAYEHGLEQELNYCHNQITHESQKFNDYKKESEEILNNSETGILSEIRVLSNMAYTEEHNPINNKINGKAPK